jgi:hypothetical protein
MRTDQSALNWLIHFKGLERQTASWIQRPQEYEFTCDHREGRKYKNSYAFSRRPCREERKHCQKVEAWEEVKQVRAIAAVAADGLDPAVIRDQLEDHDVGPILEEARAAQRPKWKDIADRSPTYKCYWTQWKYLVVKVAY